jgi:hypothetical protein
VAAGRGAAGPNHYFQTEHYSATIFDKAGQAAKSFAHANNGTPPAGYFVVGDGPIKGPKQ